MKRVVWILMFILAPFSTLLAQQTAEVLLAGYKHVPSVNSPGSGLMNVTLQSDTLFVEGSFQDLRGNYRSSAIYYGSQGENGNRLFGLKVQIDEDRKGGTFMKEENHFALRPTLREALKQGDLYINIATHRNQLGEIRGQIPPMP